jgi:gliding motility-associated protein GldM
MAGGKETPRQKLIGMMYLVLLAMLALNVSVKVLEAFVIVDEGLTKTTENFAAGNAAIYNEFAKRNAENPQRVGPWKEKADQVKDMANDLYQYIQELKYEIVRGGGSGSEDAIVEGRIKGDLLKAKENTSIASNVMLEGLDPKATQLREKINGFRDVLVSMTNPDHIGVRQSLETNLDTSNPPVKEGVTKTWEEQQFYYMPLVAAITMLSKMQADVRNAESEIITYLLNQVDAGSFMFNALEATVIPRSNYVFRGNEFEASVFIAAFDTTQAPEILIGQFETYQVEDGSFDYRMTGRADTLKVEQGKGIYRIRPTTTGYHNWGGLIRLRAPDGSFISRPFLDQYQVAEPNLIVSPSKMNVFYMGIENPVEISVPGLAADQINATTNNGTLRRVSGSSYIAMPNRLGEANISVTANIDGVTRNMGSTPFRVRTVPDPIATVAGRDGGVIGRNVLLAQTGVLAEMKDFDFDLTFTVQSFTVSSVQGGFLVDQRSNSNRLTDAQKDIIRNAPRNARIFFDDIVATGVAGERRLPTISFRID